jgi:hypothetical protein
LRNEGGWPRNENLDAGEPEEHAAECEFKRCYDHFHADRNQFQTAVDMVADVTVFAVAMVLQVAGHIQRRQNDQKPVE